ncbi:MAG: hypothetical protein K8F91_15390 [Candidatus Obscuribacterales bacterium]|nr:hypothetical protein [Candidatus Obscuribacterales bacterium]
MLNSILVRLSKVWNDHDRNQLEEPAIRTLTAFVRDTEHELYSVITALKAHIDLLHNEQKTSNLPIDRFVVIDRIIARLIADTAILSAVSELAIKPRANTSTNLNQVMQEIAEETRLEFSDRQVTLSYNIAAGTNLIGNSDSLKHMITGVIVTVLGNCKKSETLQVVSITNKEGVSIDFGSDADDTKTDFEPWDLGSMRLIPTNGDGITLSAVDAMARFHYGFLSVVTSSTPRILCRLSFAS